MRRWEDELRFDAKDALPRLTPQQRDVMMAACIGFRLKYNPNKEWRADRLKQALTAWRQGLQADKQSRQPRWNAAHIRKTEEHIAKTEKAIAADAAARKKKSDDEMKAFFGGFWGNAFALATLAFFSIGPLANFVLSWILTPGVKKREGAILARKIILNLDRCQNYIDEEDHTLFNLQLVALFQVSLGYEAQTRRTNIEAQRLQLPFSLLLILSFLVDNLPIRYVARLNAFTCEMSPLFMTFDQYF
ncbi:hypothetical protein HO173_004934 [Letharia columbiana]|uniref:Uncharacterized protein n=1 Tax=Letharia columbiana TaxID=112416 RepID=A0A8H6FXM1_9LECA|nr:uncharacterized protein HO173_004934 [Letharia columbiana]KAF6236643.1 hypothetical protein HO173_004934 [Letharia columbiana]